MHRKTFGVEPICQVLQIAPSGYRRHAALKREPHRRGPRAARDDLLVPQIERVWHANRQVYGADKVWRQLEREVRELRKANEILKLASAFFAQAELDRRIKS